MSGRHYSSRIYKEFGDWWLFRWTLYGKIDAKKFKNKKGVKRKRCKKAEFQGNNCFQLRRFLTRISMSLLRLFLRWPRFGPPSAAPGSVDAVYGGGGSTTITLVGGIGGADAIGWNDACMEDGRSLAEWWALCRRDAAPALVEPF